MLFKKKDVKKIKIRLGIKKKLTFMILIPIVLVSVLLTASCIGFTYFGTLHTYSEQAIALSEAYSSSIENLVHDLSQQFDVVTQDKKIVDKSIPLDERKEILNEKAKTSTFKDFAIAYETGKTYNNTDISERDYFKGAIANKDAYVSSPVFRMTDNSLTVMMGKYFSSDNANYVVYGGLDTETFAKNIKDVKFGDEAVCFILDKDKQVIASSTDKIELLTDLSDATKLQDTVKGLCPLAEAMHKDGTGTISVEFNGGNFFFGFTPIEGYEGWTIAVGTSEQSFLSTIQLQASISIGICISMLIIVLIVCLKIMKKIYEPILAVSDRLVKFSEGDITSPAPVCNTNDELFDMTEALARMKETIGDYIGDIQTVLTSISKGDLTVDINAAYLGDFCEIRSALEMIISSLKSVMSEVVRSTSDVKEGSRHLADGSANLSHNAVVQASAIEEITSTVLDISQKTEANSVNVQNVLEKSNKTNEKAQEGAECMKNMLVAMNNIDESSKEIQRIVKVIEDIAFQTNILSLNASIEAASAGAAGKGFAVVAEEVRQLAEKSSQAAQQTVEFINKSLHAVEKGTAIADEAAKALDEIVISVDEVSSIISEVAVASQEQANAIEQITIGIENVNDAIHSTSGTAEASAAESEQLSALAESLTDSVSRFKYE